MRKTAIALALSIPLMFAGPLLFTGSALADSFDKCTDEPQEKWKTQKEIEDVATGAGYDVRKSKIKGSCYEVYGVGKDGTLMELFYNPVTAELMFTEKKG